MTSAGLPGVVLATKDAYEQSAPAAEFGLTQKSITQPPLSLPLRRSA
jgi:hypothetical protein